MKSTNQAPPALFSAKLLCYGLGALSKKRLRRNNEERFYNTLEKAVEINISAAAKARREYAKTIYNIMNNPENWHKRIQ